MTHAPAPARRVSEAPSGADSDQTPPPPDGGWGWTVAFASFMIHIVTDGVTYSFGVLYVEFLDYFGEGKGATAWIASLLVGVTLCSGPISSSFVNKYGCRAVTIAGAVLGFICLILSMFATNILTLYFTIGIGTGLGFGLIYLPAIVSVTCWFEKYRSLATGIAVCGSGLGTFIFAPIIEYMIGEYGWRGTLLIIASLVLQCASFGALFRPVEYSKSQARAPEEVKLVVRKVSSNTSGHELGNKTDVAPIQRPLSMGNFTIPRNVLLPLHRKDAEVSDTERLTLSQPALVTLSTTVEPPARLHFGSQSLRHSGVMYRKDVFYRASLHSLPQNRPAIKYKSNMRLPHERIVEDKQSLPAVHDMSDEDEEMVKVCGVVPCSKETRDTLNEMLDVSLLKDPIFILFSLSNFCTSIGFNIPYVYIVAQAEERGIAKDSASFLLSVIGIANTVGRIVLGYVSDKPWINRLLVYNVCLTICGLATAFSALAYDFTSFAVYGSVYGFTIGAYVGLTSVILVDLLGLDKLTNAFGLLLLFQGIASLLGPPIAGWLFDAFASYNPGFYVAGVTIAASGIMLFAIPPLQRRVKANELKNRNGIIVSEPWSTNAR